MCLAVPLVAAIAVAGGCGGVQFEGKIFEAVGLAGEPEREEKTVAERAPLVLPPKRTLPPPGRPQQAAAPENWPQDPNELQRQAALAKKKKKRVCGEQDFKKKTSVESIEALADPLKECEGFIGDALDLTEAARGEGSPDNVTERPVETSTKQELPTPWRTESSR